MKEQAIKLKSQRGFERFLVSKFISKFNWGTKNNIFFMLFLLLTCFAYADGITNNSLVSVEWLKSNLNNENIVVLEVHSGETKIKYADEHIPGSVYASSVYFQTNLPDKSNVPYDIPSKENFEKLIQDLGINNETKVIIVYPGFIPKDVMCATRTFWTFSYYGMTNISILNGGLNAWKRAGYPVDNNNVAINKGNFKVKDISSNVIAIFQDVKSGVNESNTILLDSRMVPDYIGKTKQPFVNKYGHIPSAINYFAGLFLNPDMTFKNEKQIKFEMSLLGIKPEMKIITYCNSGQFATTSWFALREIAGFKNVSSYDGSVADWVNKGKQQLVKN